jgi:hypothetical protein
MTDLTVGALGSGYDGNAASLLLTLQPRDLRVDLTAVRGDDRATVFGRQILAVDRCGRLLCQTSLSSCAGPQHEACGA